MRAGFGISRNRAEIDILSGMCTLNGQLMRVKDKQVWHVLDVCYLEGSWDFAVMFMSSACIYSN